MSKKLLSRTGACFARFRLWISEHFGGTELALYHVTVTLSALMMGAALAATYWPGALGVTCLAAAMLGLLETAGWLLRRLFQAWLGHSLAWLMGLIPFVGMVVWTVKRGAGEGWSYRVFLFSALVAVVVMLLAVSLWSLLCCRRVTPVTVSATLLAVGMGALLSVFLFTDGFDNHYVRKYLALSDRRDAAQAALEPSLTYGRYAVNVLDYGPEAGLRAGTVDLSYYMDRDTDDLSGSYVEAYLDYDLNRVPLEGRVWYPASGQECPVLFIAHGNHEITTESYLGYAYLGEFLASHGYVVVSVNQNACNLLVGENDGRAVLLLEHIGLLLEYDAAEGNPLCGRIDEDRIAVAGHSRGGEMAATAALFNRYDRYPENGTVRFDYNYNIRSVIAIAPTVNQYKPADHSVELEDINYLLLHGAADRDVSRFMGMTQYENISFTGRGDYLKTALYIAGANHGQFNSLWGSYDQGGPFGPLLNVESLLSPREQQEVARIFIKVFLDVTLREDDSCKSLLTDWASYSAQLPDTVYVQCYETSRFVPIADFEEDSDLETGTMDRVSLTGYGNWWTEELVDFAGETSFDTHALRLRWEESGTYCVVRPGLDMAGKNLVFDISDRNTDAVAAGRYTLLDAEILLIDGRGRSASARLKDHATVFPVLPVRTDKLDFLFDTCTYKNAFATVTLPNSSFVEESGAFDWSDVRQIRFCFYGSGQISMDNIGLE